MIITIQNNGQLILKTPMAIFKVQMHKKVFFDENVLVLNSFSQYLGLFSSNIYFIQDFISCNLILAIFPNKSGPTQLKNSKPNKEHSLVVLPNSPNTNLRQIGPKVHEL